jgi:hypothetical protein
MATVSLRQWDARLITPSRALELVGDLGVYASQEWADHAQYEPEGGGPAAPGRWQINLRCQECGQSCAMLAQGRPGELVGVADTDAFTTSLGDLLSAVLRHRVMAHDLPLNRRSDDDGTGRAGAGNGQGD